MPMLRSEIHEILDGTHPRVGRGVAIGIYVLIILSALVIAMATLPDLSPRLQAILRWSEHILLSLFAVEYLLRLLSAPRPLHYAVSFWGIVDFLAIVPAIVFLFPDLVTMRSLRLIRLLRLLKLFRANRALDRIGEAFRQTRTELAIFTFIALVVLYLSAVGIYHFERHAQPDVFGSIPQSLWWSIATLSTVGYGDVYPVTAAGRAFTGFVLLIGIGIVAVPAGLLTAALIDQTHREAGSDHAQTTITKPDPNTEDRPQ